MVPSRNTLIWAHGRHCQFHRCRHPILLCPCTSKVKCPTTSWILYTAMVVCFPSTIRLESCSSVGQYGSQIKVSLPDVGFHYLRLRSDHSARVVPVGVCRKQHEGRHLGELVVDVAVPGEFLLEVCSVVSSGLPRLMQCAFLLKIAESVS